VEAAEESIAYLEPIFGAQRKAAVRG
jgi:hypothetical protein